MFNATPHTLKLLASLVWYSGFIILYIKGSALLLIAENIKPDQIWIWFAIFTGLFIGVLKAKYLYNRLCTNNLDRIASLKQPKIWHFYRIRFFVFLCLMIVLGRSLSSLAHDNYPALIIIAIIELSVATALLGSSHQFWKTPHSEKKSL